MLVKPEGFGANCNVIKKIKLFSPLKVTNLKEDEKNLAN